MAALLSLSVVKAQEITVAPGTDFYISPATVFSAGGLSLTPSTGFTLNGLSLGRHTTLLHSTANNHISRVYRFSGNTPAYTGSIQVAYLDGELAGIGEPSLRLNIHNNTSWKAFASAVNDGTSNYVLTNGISSQVLNEITLASVQQALPLQWGAVSAFRRGSNVIIHWITEMESAASHFDVERSTDSRNWVVVAAAVPATNRSVRTQYQQTDTNYNSQQLFYRVKQTDRSGGSRYSSWAVVAPKASRHQLLVYPNPARHSFTITGIDRSQIQTTSVFRADGTLVKTWSGQQATYILPKLPAGLYHLRLQTADGRLLNQPLLID